MRGRRLPARMAARRADLAADPTRLSIRGSPHGLLGAGICALALLFAPACHESGEKTMNRVDDLAFQGRYEEALYLLDELIASIEDSDEPEQSDLRLEALATAGRISHLFQRRPEKALSYYRRVVETSPGSPEAFEAHQRMARLHLEFGDRSGAIAQLQALVAGFPESEETVRFQYELARIYFSVGDMEQARTEARHLLERWPESDYVDRVRMLGASTFQLQGRMEEALEVYREIRRTSRDPETAARALFEEAGCLASLEREEEAVAAYLEALETHPEPRFVRLRLDRLRSRMARKEMENLGEPWR